MAFQYGFKRFKTGREPISQMNELIQNPGLQHLALHIFKTLDFKTLVTCRAVSKDWKSLIENDKHWWRSQLLECVSISPGYRCFRQGYFPGSLDDDTVLVGPVFKVALKPLKNLHPEFVQTFDFIYEKENLSTVQSFTEFMIDYFKTLKTKDTEGPLHYAASIQRLDIFEIMARTPIGNVKLLSI